MIRCTKRTYVNCHWAKNVQIGSFFWSVFSHIWTKYGDLRSKSLYSVQIRENTDQRYLRIRTLFKQCVLWLKLNYVLCVKGRIRNIFVSPFFVGDLEERSIINENNDDVPTEAVMEIVEGDSMKDSEIYKPITDNLDNGTHRTGIMEISYLNQTNIAPINSSDLLASKPIEHGAKKSNFHLHDKNYFPKLMVLDSVRHRNKNKKSYKRSEIMRIKNITADDDGEEDDDEVSDNSGDVSGDLSGSGHDMLSYTQKINASEDVDSFDYDNEPLDDDRKKDTYKAHKTSVVSKNVSVVNNPFVKSKYNLQYNNPNQISTYQRKYKVDSVKFESPSQNQHIHTKVFHKKTGLQKTNQNRVWVGNISSSTPASYRQLAYQTFNHLMTNFSNSLYKTQYATYLQADDKKYMKSAESKNYFYNYFNSPGAAHQTPRGTLTSSFKHYKQRTPQSLNIDSQKIYMYYPNTFTHAARQANLTQTQKKKVKKVYKKVGLKKSNENKVWKGNVSDSQLGVNTIFYQPKGQFHGSLRITPEVTSFDNKTVKNLKTPSYHDEKKVYQIPHTAHFFHEAEASDQLKESFHEHKEKTHKNHHINFVKVKAKTAKVKNISCCHEYKRRSVIEEEWEFGINCCGIMKDYSCCDGTIEVPEASSLTKITWGDNGQESIVKTQMPTGFIKNTDSAGLTINQGSIVLKPSNKSIEKAKPANNVPGAYSNSAYGQQSRTSSPNIFWKSGPDRTKPIWGEYFIPGSSQLIIPFTSVHTQQPMRVVWGNVEQSAATSHAQRYKAQETYPMKNPLLTADTQKAPSGEYSKLGHEVNLNPQPAKVKKISQSETSSSMSKLTAPSNITLTESLNKERAKSKKKQKYVLETNGSYHIKRPVLPELDLSNASYSSNPNGTNIKRPDIKYHKGVYYPTSHSVSKQEAIGSIKGPTAYDLSVSLHSNKPAHLLTGSTHPNNTAKALPGAINTKNKTSSNKLPKVSSNSVKESDKSKNIDKFPIKSSKPTGHISASNLPGTGHVPTKSNRGKAKGRKEDCGMCEKGKTGATSSGTSLITTTPKPKKVKNQNEKTLAEILVEGIKYKPTTKLKKGSSTKIKEDQTHGVSEGKGKKGKNQNEEYERGSAEGENNHVKNGNKTKVKTPIPIVNEQGVKLKTSTTSATATPTNTKTTKSTTKAATTTTTLKLTTRKTTSTTRKPTTTTTTTTTPRPSTKRTTSTTIKPTTTTTAAATTITPKPTTKRTTSTKRKTTTTMITKTIKTTKRTTKTRSSKPNVTSTTKPFNSTRNTTTNTPKSTGKPKSVNLQGGKKEVNLKENKVVPYTESQNNKKSTEELNTPSYATPPVGGVPPVYWPPQQTVLPQGVSLPPQHYPQVTTTTSYGPVVTSTISVPTTPRRKSPPKTSVTNNAKTLKFTSKSFKILCLPINWPCYPQKVEIKPKTARLYPADNSSLVPFKPTTAPVTNFQFVTGQLLTPPPPISRDTNVIPKFKKRKQHQNKVVAQPVLPLVPCVPSSGNPCLGQPVLPLSHVPISPNLACIPRPGFPCSLSDLSISDSGTAQFNQSTTNGFPKKVPVWAIEVVNTTIINIPEQPTPVPAAIPSNTNVTRIPQRYNNSILFYQPTSSSNNTNLATGSYIGDKNASDLVSTNLYKEPQPYETGDSTAPVITQPVEKIENVKTDKPLEKFASPVQELLTKANFKNKGNKPYTKTPKVLNITLPTTASTAAVTNTQFKMVGDQINMQGVPGANISKDYQWQTPEVNMTQEYNYQTGEGQSTEFTQKLEYPQTVTTSTEDPNIMAYNEYLKEYWKTMQLQAQQSQQSQQQNQLPQVQQQQFQQMQQQGECKIHCIFV